MALGIDKSFTRHFWNCSMEYLFLSPFTLLPSPFSFLLPPFWYQVLRSGYSKYTDATFPTFIVSPMGLDCVPIDLFESHI